MVSSTRKTSYRTFRPVLKFYKVFFLTLVTSSIISANCVKYHKNDFNQFITFLICNFFISTITYFGTFSLIKHLKKRGFVGTNLNAVKSAEKVAEPGALLGCVVYILVMVLFQIILRGRHENVCQQKNNDIVETRIKPCARIDRDNDVAASLPLCLAYSGTELSLYRSFQWLSSRGYRGRMLTYVIVVMTTVFCANAINIYAGINGLEIGQSLVMAFFITIYNSMDAFVGSLKNVPDPSWERVRCSIITHDQRLYTYYFTLPFIAVNVSLLCFNWYPAKLFPGNVYTLFSGAFFSTITVIGELWEVLPFLMLPQLINFFISIPQLVGIVKCPRHRIPKFNNRTNKLENSKNYTLLNLFLMVCGPTSEEGLTKALLCLQTLCCLLGLIYKYYMM
ncbi:glycosyl transferase, family 4 protein [Theileria orientalis strain Shintoku]|uniref:UDP-N-acetylglucosamine--dolichyl-phosphate N-acetylglucosaminephosphotransferase n=1 Tax=Theileria orientalis strain Shintoku TaxID=869250 RepID=J7MBW1_THEOR|nr:glycosyl transferase, family 4 protein [Theileria orientalis strain Shintoku]BAM38642.1 glycosyl transferase, family 4 protein [Theileria orientalis strain Shintoku]|eukprot:XP_009688943.1 glycosyl transferase, family 4 protein [Theileria orientalis strain Shintoku]